MTDFYKEHSKVYVSVDCNCSSETGEWIRAAANGRSTVDS